MSFAPYTMQYLKIVVNGKCRICSVELVEYKHRKVPYEVQIPEDPVLKKIYQAAEESFLANATDVFMDCPSRERGGWLCDSYFTSQTEFVLTGRNDLEHDFLRGCCLCAIPQTITMETLFQTGPCGLCWNWNSM